MGLISFAGVATVECPSRTMWRPMLGGLNTNRQRPGTDIGGAGLAEKGFLGAGGSNVLLLITDGEDLGNNTLTQAQRLSSGSEDHTMGVGKEGIAERATPSPASRYYPARCRRLREMRPQAGNTFPQPGQGEIDSILQDVYSAERVGAAAAT